MSGKRDRDDRSKSPHRSEGKKERSKSPHGKRDAPESGSSAAAVPRGAKKGRTGLNPVEKIVVKSAGVLSDMKFTDLEKDLSKATRDGIAAMQYEFMTNIQKAAIPYLLEGRDVLAQAKTGSGKTIAFLVPSVEMLHRSHFAQRNGTGVIIISPTRELSMQTYTNVRDLMQFHTNTHGIVMGGAARKPEAEKLSKGVNLIVATPGRLLDHMQNTRGFVFKNLQILVIDEADRILDNGFEEEMQQILKLLPAERQTMLFSATQEAKVDNLAQMSLKQAPVVIEVEDEDNSAATVSGLQQGYVVCESHCRFLLLFAFLKRNLKRKIIVFFSSCNAVKFYAELLNYVDLPVLDLHGNQKQQKRTTTFFEFCNADKGILLSTDVAARGLDVPAVDWIVQFDPPDNPRDYIHRVGRTARGVSGEGRALLLLLPTELGFLKYLRQANVEVQEYEFPIQKIAGVQPQLERLIEKNYYLHRSALDAFRSYILSYSAHGHKDIYHVDKLDLAKVAKSFGFAQPPKINMNFSHREKPAKKPTPGSGSRGKERSGHAFSSSNPYGVRDKSDSRQFVRG